MQTYVEHIFGELEERVKRIEDNVDEVDHTQRAALPREYYEARHRELESKHDSDIHKLERRIDLLERITSDSGAIAKARRAAFSRTIAITSAAAALIAVTVDLIFRIISPQ